MQTFDPLRKYPGAHVFATVKLVHVSTVVVLAQAEHYKVVVFKKYPGAHDVTVTTTLIVQVKAEALNNVGVTPKTRPVDADVQLTHFELNLV